MNNSLSCFGTCWNNFFGICAYGCQLKYKIGHINQFSTQCMKTILRNLSHVITPSLGRLLICHWISFIFVTYFLSSSLNSHVLNSGNCRPFFQLGSGVGHIPIDILKQAHIFKDKKIKFIQHIIYNAEVQSKINKLFLSPVTTGRGL